MEMIEGSISELKRALDVSHVRNRVIAENIANSETPGFKGSSVDFQRAMADANSSADLNMSKTNSMHIFPGGRDEAVKIDKEGGPARADGNNVDQNMEMVRLSENAIIYSTAADLLNRKIKLLKFAIEEGGK